MKKLTIILFLLGFANYSAFSQAQKPKEKLKRADCFFGVHFDLHASEDITNAGQTLTTEMVDTFLTKVKPDFIQIDCKGHPGISSYPTKVGFHVKGFDKDPLKLFREVTEKNKVALFMHFSGVWDGKVVKEHPDWSTVKANGERSTEKTSFFSPYLDTYMIPQLKELSDYGVDGAWIDGECWAVEPDYGEASLSRFTKETGITEIPRKSSDKYYPEFMEYTRKLFREHLQKYITAIHAYNPKFQITSNWAYSSLMPEKVTVDVDYLSGDVTPQNGVYRSAFEARCLAPQGKPWDLMAWGFSWNGGKMPMSIKSSVQLEQEAAEIMAMGGGVQFYYQQNRDLSLKPWLATSLSEIGKFCRERQQFCHKAKAIPQIALLYPTASYLKHGTRPFSNSTNTLQGAMNLILDGQYPVEILMEQHLQGKMSQYPLIVIPECIDLETSFVEELRTYVAMGGHLLVIGSESAKIFQKELGIKTLENIDEGTAFIAANQKIGSLRSSLLNVGLMPEAKVTSNFYNSSDFVDKSTKIASSVNQVGKGTIAAVYFNAGSSYLEYKSPVLRDFIANRIGELFSDPIVTVSGSHLVHLAVNQLKDKTYVNLINVAGEHTNQAAIGYDEIPALKDLSVSIKTLKRPSRILLQPEGGELKFDYQDGTSKVKIANLAIHSILEIVP
ncbi:MAG: alpha-amylase family protein [Mariniphaga sp.]